MLDFLEFLERKGIQGLQGLKGGAGHRVLREYLDQKEFPGVMGLMVL